MHKFHADVNGLSYKAVSASTGPGEGIGMLAGFLSAVRRVHLVLAALALCIVVCEPQVRRYGDRMQVVLPMVAWACAATEGRGRELVLRFAGVFVAAHASKRLLGDIPMNTRPSGGEHGFPSAHTAAAAFGASALVHDCIAGHPVARALVVISAAFVGGSRIEVGAHDLWQVLAGGLLGWGGDRMLRADSPLRRRIAGRLARAGRRLWLAFRLAGRMAARLLFPAAGLRRRGLALPVLLILAGLVLPALPLRAEQELSFYTGTQGAADSRIEDSLGSFITGWEGHSLRSPPYYGVRLTRWRPDGIGYGFEINHAKVYSDDPASHGYDRLEFTDGLNIVTVNLWKRWPALQSGLVPYVGAGLGVAVPHVDIQPTGEAHTFGYQLTGPAAQIVAGASYPLAGNWSVFGEVKGTWSRHRVDLDSGGVLRTEITTHALNFGLTWRF